MKRCVKLAFLRNRRLSFSDADNAEHARRLFGSTIGPVMIASSSFVPTSEPAQALRNRCVTWVLGALRSKTRRIPFALPEGIEAERVKWKVFLAEGGRLESNGL